MYPVLFDLGGGLVIHSYSVFLALGYLVAYWVVSAEINRRKMDPSLPAVLLLACFIAGLAGAKILFLYQNATLAGFFADPARYFASGFSSVGGLAGIFLALWVVSRLRKTHFQILLDVVCPALILGYGVGRIGCFLNGCDYGTACSLPWAVSFSQRVVNVHPTQLYDTLFTALLFVFLWKTRAEDRPTGFVSAVGFAILGTQRFFIEFIRETTPSFIEGLSQAQLAALLLVAVFGTRLFQLSGGVLGKRARV